MVCDAARSRIGGGGGDVGRIIRGGGGKVLVSGVGGKLVSRSAPDSSEGDDGVAQRLRERRLSNTLLPFLATTVAPSMKSTTTASGGYYFRR